MTEQPQPPEVAGLVSRLPLGALLSLAWLFPGLGHLLTGRRARAGVFAVIILTGFAVGIALGGELFVPERGDPLSYLATVASAGNGALYWLSKVIGLGRGVVTSASYEFGNTFLLTAGMMNLLLVLDIYDIMTGRKSW